MTTLGEETLQPRSTSDEDGEVLVRVENVSKKFCRSLKRSLWYGLQDTAIELSGQKSKDGLRKDEFWAVKDVSFVLRKGESLGLVGSNGAGKTTLLRMISGLIKPNEGSITVKGQVAPLIALGAGFNPILTGRENVYANMSILGLTKGKIDKLFQQVIDFSELNDVIETPVGAYSSGMMARLGFSCAVFTSPEILIIDEALAVGDISFKSKCYRIIEDLKKSGTSIIMVSHNPEAILSVCHTSILLERGKVIEFGSTHEVISQYESRILEHQSICNERSRFISNEIAEEARFLDIFFRDSKGKIVEKVVSGEPASLCMKIEAFRYVANLCVKLSIRRSSHSGEVLFLNSLEDGEKITILTGISEIQLQMQNICLMPGRYDLAVAIHDGNLYQFDIARSFGFEVMKRKEQVNIFRSSFFQPRKWEKYER